MKQRFQLLAVAEEVRPFVFIRIGAGFYHALPP